MGKAMNECTVLAISAAVLTTACSVDPAQARRTLEAHGLVDIYIGDYAWFGCGQNDYFSSAFTAKTREGRPASGTVCCGLVKNCTVRIE